MTVAGRAVNEQNGKMGESFHCMGLIDTLNLLSSELSADSQLPYVWIQRTSGPTSAEQKHTTSFIWSVAVSAIRDTSG